MMGAGWTLSVGQASIRTVPPVTVAAAANGSALERSGSIAQSWGCTVAAFTRHWFGTVVSTSTPASASIAAVMAMCGADGR